MGNLEATKSGRDVGPISLVDVAGVSYGSGVIVSDIEVVLYNNSTTNNVTGTIRLTQPGQTPIDLDAFEVGSQSSKERRYSQAHKLHLNAADKLDAVFSTKLTTAINLAAGYAAGLKVIVVDSVTGMQAGDEIVIGTGATQETHVISSIVTTSNTITLVDGLANMQANDAAVVYYLPLNWASSYARQGQ